ncbi:hypothetical protein [Calothrix sp. PCC 7507]|uniref:hypothetical protein n=1 Tax=Calothrix sp. PCC 7507 TaxID=99598 RepID=UPI00029F3B98|nr:hypothetical protein [Calothrix sp. PCC 7507]AFY34468.1 hypothetical protein Cal7507_4086 [Calothrix sp. PCC 7507]
MFKIFPYFDKFSTASVFIALLMALDTTVLAQPVTAPPATPPPVDQSTNAIAQKLLGQWEAKDPASPITLNFIFSPDGKLFIFSPNSQASVAVEFKYSINPTLQPMHLDITIPSKKEPVLTIFELTADGKLRLQLDNTDPGKPRPKAFSETPALFTKVSDTTKLPENVKLIDPSI